VVALDYTDTVGLTSVTDTQGNVYVRAGSEVHQVTGHIDFLQIRNGYIHILDYKPEARKETHAHVQLTIYALALARRTGLPLKFFKCGWFRVVKTTPS
jgi:ATP-dependent exoDNAse (exonuclease V) beta subunit